MQEHQYTVRQERGGCLTAWLVFLTIANVLAIILGFALTGTLGPLSLLSVVSGTLALIGVVGTWQMKKWGYHTLIAFYLLGVIVGLLSLAEQSGSASAGPIIGSLIGLGITSALVLNKWEDFE
jgi:hypothetical protein